MLKTLRAAALTIGAAAALLPAAVTAQEMRLRLTFEVPEDGRPDRIARALGERLRLIGIDGAPVVREGNRVSVDVEAATRLDDWLRRHLTAANAVGIHVVAEKVSCPAGVSWLVCADGDEGLSVAIEARPRIDGTGIVSATATEDGITGAPAVDLVLTDGAARRFCRLSGVLVGRRIAVVIDGYAIAVPEIPAPVCGGVLSIHGGFEADRTQQIADTLLAPSYPVAIALVSEDLVEVAPVDVIESWRDYLPERPVEGNADETPGEGAEDTGEADPMPMPGGADDGVADTGDDPAPGTGSEAVGGETAPATDGAAQDGDAGETADGASDGKGPALTGETGDEVPADGSDGAAPAE